MSSPRNFIARDSPAGAATVRPRWCAGCSSGVRWRAPLSTLKRRAGDAAMERLRHRDRRGVVLLADDHGRRHLHAGKRVAQVGAPEHAAGLGIGLHVVAQEDVDAMLHHVRMARAERIAEPARGLELDQRAEPGLHRLVGALGPLLGRLGAVPGGGVDEPERGRARRDRPPRRRARCSRPWRRRRPAPRASRHGRAGRRDRARTARPCRGRRACRTRRGRGSRRPAPRRRACSTSGAQKLRSMASEWTSTARGLPGPASCSV